MGRNGDLPNDFKLQFSAAVLRGPAIGDPLYAIYGSLFVIIPNDDPEGTRVFPPFQGNGGGPSGGPLMSLKGKTVDHFFHPTAVRPGSILQLGERISFAGYSAPPLPSKLEIVITAPSGATRVIEGQANKIGYFHDPSQDFPVGETGVWKTKVKITFDGIPSAGPVAAPFPTGDILGSRDGEFFFYVVDRDAPPLIVTPPQSSPPPNARAAQLLRPADGPLTFTITPAPDLHDIQLTYTTTMPGFILEEGTSTALQYTYEAQRLAQVFPNLDRTDGDGFAGADVITISLLVSGTDANGTRRPFARQIVLAGEELLMPEQKPLPPRRHAARK